MSGKYSELVGVYIDIKGRGCLVGVWPDGSTDLVEGPLAKLRPIVMDILNARHVPKPEPERPPDAMLN